MAVKIFFKEIHVFFTFFNGKKKREREFTFQYSLTKVSVLKFMHIKKLYKQNYYIDTYI